MRFQARYGHIWSSQFQSEEMAEVIKLEWAAVLSEFSADRVYQVAEYCFDQRSMPPNLTEFRILCRPQMKDFGLPPADRAYREACVASHSPSSAKWSHPAVYWAGKRFGWVELFQGSFGAEKRFSKIYEQICRRVMAGEKVELPTQNPTALEHQETLSKNRTVQEIQTARQCCSELLQGLREIEVNHGRV